MSFAFGIDMALKEVIILYPMGGWLSKSLLADISHVFPKSISFIHTWRMTHTHGFSSAQS